MQQRLNRAINSNEALLQRVRELEQTAGRNGTILSSSRRLTLRDLFRKAQAQKRLDEMTDEMIVSNEALRRRVRKLEQAAGQNGTKSISSQSTE